MAEAQVALETENQLRARFTAVEEQVSRLERELEDVQQAVEGGRPYRGKEGRALAAEEERLARKELLLREKEGRLHEDIRVHMRIRCDQQRRASEGMTRLRWGSFHTHRDKMHFTIRFRVCLASYSRGILQGFAESGATQCLFPWFHLTNPLLFTLFFHRLYPAAPSSLPCLRSVVSGTAEESQVSG